MRGRFLGCQHVATLGVALMVVMLSACGSTRPSPSTSTAAGRFLARYVTPDGRVLRHDQGGDIVSEGQAYGMLIAELAGRPQLVTTIWDWTKGHLRQPDGLFAWHASASGEIEDPQSAGDADVLLAYALCRYEGPNADRLNAAGSRVAAAVLSHETVPLPDGTPLLAAGPWAAAGSEPIINPSYLMPGVFEALGRCTGNAEWHAMAEAGTTLLGQLTEGGSLLPTDWAKLKGDRLVPIADPGGGAPIQYGLDAARIPVFLASSCSAAATNLAASLWRRVLSRGDRSEAIALGQNGSVIDSEKNPLTLISAAAAAGAADMSATAIQLRRAAVAASRSDPTYYGDAWVVIGSAFADGSLDPCKEAVHG